MRDTKRFKVKGKLAPRYIGHFQVLDHKGEVAYRLELPPYQMYMTCFTCPRGVDTTRAT
jgi:hypothetical protein